MWVLVASLALAGPPDGVDLNDLDVYETLANDFLSGPAGCWNVVGTVDARVSLGRFGSSRSTGQMVGKIEDGVWLGYQLLVLYGRVPHPSTPGWTVGFYADEGFTPIVGRHGHLSEDSGAVGVLGAIFDELSSAVDAAWIQWEEDRSAVVLHRNVALGKGRRAPVADVVTVFPGGDPRVQALDVRFPERFHTGKLRWRISDARVHIVGNAAGQPFPAREEVSAEIGVLGFTFSVRQVITYDVVAECR